MPNYRVFPGTNSTQSELSIDIHPLNPSIIFGSANATPNPVQQFMALVFTGRPMRVRTGRGLMTLRLEITMVTLLPQLEQMETFMKVISLLRVEWV